MHHEDTVSALSRGLLQEDPYAQQPTKSTQKILVTATSRCTFLNLKKVLFWGLKEGCLGHISDQGNHPKQTV